MFHWSLYETLVAHIEQATISWESDVYAFGFNLTILCFTKHHAEEDWEQGWQKDEALFDAIRDGKAVWEDAIIFDLAHLILMELMDDSQEL